MANIKLGDKDAAESIRPLFTNTAIWGVDLNEVGLADQVAGYFEELVSGKGAVRSTLKKYGK